MMFSVHHEHSGHRQQGPLDKRPWHTWDGGRQGWPRSASSLPAVLPGDLPVVRFVPLYVVRVPYNKSIEKVREGRKAYSVPPENFIVLEHLRIDVWFLALRPFQLTADVPRTFSAGIVPHDSYSARIVAHYCNMLHDLARVCISPSFRS